MKIKGISIVLMLVICSVLLYSRMNSGSKTIEGALRAAGAKQFQILYEEKNKEGSIVFFTHPREDSLFTAVIKKPFLSGYKLAYDSVEGDAKLAAKRLGLTDNYLPVVKGTSFPVYFGIIGNHDISDVKVVELKRNIEQRAKIINTNGMRIWLVYMKNLKGSKFDIVGLSSKKKELCKYHEDISPWYADQKPFNSTY